MEIITSRVSVYEIELDLRNWRFQNSSQVPNFAEKLLSIIPSLKNHKCMTGTTGGFVSEVKKGTNFAHVIEHVILELLILSDFDKQIYKGWTRKKTANTYVIHYSAPNFLTGRLVAILGVDLIRRLINDEKINLNYYFGLLKNPIKYFAEKERISTTLPDLVEPISVIPEFESNLEGVIQQTQELKLSEKQLNNITSIIGHINKHFNFIVTVWRNSFFSYAGNFGNEIIDKIELINIDKFIDFLLKGDFQSFYNGIRNLSQIIRSYRIPTNFIIRSIWLYKNSLLTYIIEEYEEDKTFLHQAISDFEIFYQIIFQHSMEGFSKPFVKSKVKKLSELKEFKELEEKRGKILIVDDDEIVRSASRDILEHYGFQTILAKDGTEALEILIMKHDEISLVILDLFMPKMDGKEVYTRMRSLRPFTKILVTTGYPIDEQMKKQFIKGTVSFISKPFEVKALIAKINVMLESDSKNSI